MYFRSVKTISEFGKKGGGAPKGILSTHTCGFIMRFSWEIPHKFYNKFANPKVIMNPSFDHISVQIYLLSSHPRCLLVLKFSHQWY